MNNKKYQKTINEPFRNDIAIILLNKVIATNTLKKMKKQLEILKQDTTFREYIGFKMCMKIFFKNYEKWIVVDNEV